MMPNFKIINKNKAYKSKFVRDFIKRYSIILGKLRSKILSKPIGIIRFTESLNKKEKNRISISNDLRDNLIKKFSQTNIDIQKIVNRNFFKENIERID